MGMDALIWWTVSAKRATAGDSSVSSKADSSMITREPLQVVRRISYDSAQMGA